MIYGVTGMWGANKLGIIKYRIKNVKIFLIAIIWLFILDVYLADYRSMAMTLGLKDGTWKTAANSVINNEKKDTMYIQNQEIKKIMIQKFL